MFTRITHKRLKRSLYGKRTTPTRYLGRASSRWIDHPQKLDISRGAKICISTGKPKAHDVFYWVPPWGSWVFLSLGGRWQLSLEMRGVQMLSIVEHFDLFVVFTLWLFPTDPHTRRVFSGGWFRWFPNRIPNWGFFNVIFDCCRFVFLESDRRNVTLKTFPSILFSWG